MYLSRQNLECHVAAKENGRFAFRSIALTAEGSVSTDGTMLLIVPYPKVEQTSAPVIKGIEHAPIAEGEVLLIDPEDAKKAAKMVRKKPYRLEWGLIHVRKVKSSIKIGAMDGAGTQTMTVKEADGEFPPYKNVLPDYKDMKAVSFSLEKLHRAVTTLMAASKKEETVTMHFLDDRHAVKFVSGDGVTLYIMPVEIGGEQPAGEPAPEQSQQESAPPSEIVDEPIEVESTATADAA